jgi:Pilus formation protein N terminal region
MRDARRQSAKPSKLRRRTVLAVLLLASTPVLADGPQRKPSLPPLPLSAGQHVQTNPFCQDTVKLPADQIRLASGTTASAIRLLPVGTAIGLQSIDGQPTAQRVKPPAMVIENVQPQVQTNPLIGSAHHENGSLVPVTVDQPVATADGQDDFDPQATSRNTPITAKRGSTIVLIPPAPTYSAPAQAAQEYNQFIPQPATPAPAPVANAVAPIAVTPAPAVNVSAPAAAAAEAVESEPVYFSLSDRFEHPVAPAHDSIPQPEMEAAAQAPPEQVALAEPQEVAEEPAAELIVEVDEPATDNELVKLADDAAMEPEAADSQPAEAAIDVAESISMDEADADSLQPIESVLNSSTEPATATYGSAAIVSGPVENSEATLRTQRYRPPVAVKVVPLAVERALEAEPAAASLVPASELDLDGFGSSLEKNVKLTPLYLTRTQVRSLTLSGSVRNVEVADKSVCQAFAAGPNQLKLIGTGSGVTRLVVWADTPDPDKPTRMRAFEIHVSEAPAASGKSVQDHSAMLNQSIRQAFPNSAVSVRQKGEELIVSGRCDSDDSAKKIMRMIRKTCQIPVRDELVVR